MSHASTARRAGVSARTIQRRVADPGFSAQVRAIRTELLERSVVRLRAANLDAVACLKKLLTCESDQVRCQAARSILELSVKLGESIEFERRLAALEGRDQQPERLVENRIESPCGATLEPYRQNGSL
ncbi:MAG: hypothetical protein ACYC35_27305, partial [Pirellulales bacterium]